MKESKTLVCTIGRLENLYIREWVEHYKKLGFSNICLYDNNRDGEEHFEDVIGDYIDSGFVILKDFRNKKVCQLEAYEDCYKTYGQNYDWIAFFDADEFLELKDDNNISEYLSRAFFKDAAAITINWVCYGDCDKITYENKAIQERFSEPILPLDKHIQYPQIPQNFHTKSIVRGGLSTVEWKDTPHMPTKIASSGKILNSSGKEKLSLFNKTDAFKFAYLKHYTTKSTEEYANKVKRGFPDQEWDCKKMISQIDIYFRYNSYTSEKLDLFEQKTGLDLSSIKEKYEKKNNMKVALIGIAKQENRYLREWVEHYKSLGYSNIILCDNNDIDGETFGEVIGDYINDGFVIVEDWRGKSSCQYPAYEACYEKYNANYDWLSFFDIDEFLTLPHYENVVEYLFQGIFDDSDIIHINWLCFGDNKIVEDDGSGVLGRFTRPTEPLDFKKTYPNIPENFHVKSFIRGGKTGVKFPTAHNPQFENAVVCNSYGTKLQQNIPFQNFNYDAAYLKHFCTKTIYEYIEKIKKGDVTRKLTEEDRRDWAKKFFAYNEVTEEKVEIFKKELGYNFSYMLPNDFNGEKRKDVQIFSLCYEKKDFSFLNDAVITPLQVGAANGTDVCTLKDNEGDNISGANYFYVENTGTYWIWRNVNDAKYKGQMQYRRPLSGISETTDFETIFKDYDVITCEPFHHPSHKTPTAEEPMVIVADTVAEGYAFSHCPDDLFILEMAVKAYFPDYAEDWDKYIKNGPNLYYSNGFIMKAEDYDRYAIFLFNCLNGYLEVAQMHTQQEILDHVKYNLEVGKYQRYGNMKNFPENVVRWQSELGGFLSERVWTLWVQHNFPQERICKLPYIKMEENMYT